MFFLKVYPGKLKVCFLMPPKTKKRKVKESEEDIVILEKLTEAFFKYRHEEVLEEEDDNVGMFGAESDEIPKIHVSDMERVAEEVGVEWDEAVIVVVDPEKRKKGVIDIETMKLVISALKVNYELYFLVSLIL
jgi:hypothetical protein